MIELEAVGSVSSGNRIVTDASHILIGRSPASQFVLPDRHVSWHHGEIVCRDGQYYYSDLRSTHGSVLRRGNIDRPVQSVRLKDGDLILLAGQKNVIRVNCVAPNLDVQEDFAVTIVSDDSQYEGKSEDLFVDDAGVLRVFLNLERALSPGQEAGRAGMLQALIECLKSLYPELDYVAVLEEKGAHIVLEQSLSVKNLTYPRKSSKICRKARKRDEGLVFEITAGRVYTGSGDFAEVLSDQSATIEHDTSGICVPLRPDMDACLFIQLERAVQHGQFTRRDLSLVHAMTVRTEDRIRQLAITSRYNAASQNAALGIFAQTLAHDIKNALAFAPFLWDKLKDPEKHVDVVRGVETAYQLARSLQSPSRSDSKAVHGFSLNEMGEGIMRSFASLFEGRCKFVAQGDASHGEIVGYGRLLHRTLWNLVLNAYNAHENRDGVLPENRYVRIVVRPDVEGWSRIRVEDNAGGMDRELLGFFQNSFTMIRDACEQESDILRVVEMIKGQEGAVNRVGLFFTAIAVNDMHGKLVVDSTPGEGTRFTIELPSRIEGLKGLLQF